jgi:hypothetical protein
MTITTTDVTNALVGVVVNTTPGQANPQAVGYEAVILPTHNADGSYTVNRAPNSSADGFADITFQAYTFPDGSTGLTYTALGTPFYVKVEAFTATQVLLQGYTSAGALVTAGQHFILQDGGTIAQLGTPLPFTLYPTGSSYTTPAGVTIGTAPCFARGTIIATLDGDVAVENLREGDLVLTVSGEAKPLVWVGSRAVSVARHPQPENVRPVRITRSAFSPNVPSRDLVVSPDHNLFVENVLIPAKCLVNGRTVVLADVETVEYHHIELASHDVVYANGLEAETYLDTGNRTSFAGQAVTVAHPDFASAPDQNYFAWDANGYARLVLEGAEVDLVRARLAARADELAQLESAARRRSA